MKGYGLPRILDIEHPDVMDIKNYGLKSAIGTLRGKGGDFKGYFKNKEAKRNTRRIYKKLARRLGKSLCKEEG